MPEELLSDADVGLLPEQPAQPDNLFSDSDVGLPAVLRPPSSALRRYVADPAIALAKGVVGLPEAVVGLADIPTLGYAGKLLEAGGYGFQPKVTKDYLSTLYSPEQQAANREVQKAKGFFPTVKAMVTNPSTVADSVLESLPSMVGGAAAARKLLTVAPKLGPLIAGAIGEGAVTAGQTAEQTRQASESGTLTPKQAILSTTSGAATGLISVLGGGLAKRLGVTDIDTLMAGGAVTAEAAKKNILRRVVESAITEGAFEELPQSAQEQIQQNLANNKPAMDGVAEAAATGLLAGIVMGGAGGVLGGSRAATPETPALIPPFPGQPDITRDITQEVQTPARPAVLAPPQAAPVVVQTPVTVNPTPTDTSLIVPPTPTPPAVTAANDTIARSIEKATGFTLVKKDQNAAAQAPTPETLATYTPEERAMLAEIQAKYPAEWEFTDQRPGSPTEGRTFRAPLDATRAQMLESYQKAVPPSVPNAQQGGPAPAAVVGEQLVAAATPVVQPNVPTSNVAPSVRAENAQTAEATRQENLRQQALREVERQKLDPKSPLTPIQQQYGALKDKYPNELVMIRLGDFYEAFWDDAKKLSDVLDAGKRYKNSLTNRNGVPMAGVPYHSIDRYVSQLEAAGHTVKLVEDYRSETTPAPASDVSPKQSAQTGAEQPREIAGPSVSDKPKVLTPSNVNTTADVQSAQAAKPLGTGGEFSHKVAKEQKKFLLDAVDQAISEAPQQRSVVEADTDQTTVDGLRNWRSGDTSETFKARREQELPELFEKYQIPSRREAYKDPPSLETGVTVTGSYPASDLSTDSRFDLLDAAIKQAVMSQSQKVTIEVPRDGTFSVINSKAALQDFKERAQQFPTSAGGFKAPTKARTTATPAIKLGKTDRDNTLEALAPITSEDKDRKMIHQKVWSDGKQTVATNGRMLTIVYFGVGGTVKSPGVFSTDGKPVKLAKDEKFPDWTQVIPQQTKDELKGVDTERLLMLLRQAQEVTTERSISVLLVFNKDGTLGISANSPDLGSYESNAQRDDAKQVVAVDPKYLTFALNAARRVGDTTITIKWMDELSPIVVESKNTRSVVMPMRLSTGIGEASNEPTGQNKYPTTTDSSRVEADLRASGVVLWGTADEIAQILADAARLRLGEQAGIPGRLPEQRTLHSVTEARSAEDFQTKRFFIQTDAATPAVRRNAEILAHRLLYGEQGTDQPLLQRVGQSDFVHALSTKTGVRVVFRDTGNRSYAQYQPIRGAGDFIFINTRRLGELDFTTQAASFDAVLSEELLHVVTRLVATEQEVLDVWDSLSPKEQADTRKAYDLENKNEPLTPFSGGMEYIRFVLQQRLQGRVTEATQNLSEAMRNFLRKLLNYLVTTFGNKPSDNIARQIIDRIEGAIRGDAPIQQSIFEGGEAIRSGISSVGQPTGGAEDEARGSVIDPATGEWVEEAAEGSGDIVQIAGIEYNIVGKERLTPEQKAAADARARDFFGKELNLPGEPDLSAGKQRGAIDTNLVFKIEADGENHDDAGQRLLDHLIEQVQSQHQPGGNPAYVSSLVNALNKNFNVGNLQGVFSDGMIQRLMEISVGESSWRGTMLRAITGITEDMGTVARNAKFFLRRTYENMFGGDLTRKIMDRIALNFRERFTGEEIERLYNENPILQELFLKVVARLKVKPSLRDVIAEIFATPINKQDDIVERFVDTMVNKFSATPSEAARLKAEFSRTFEASFNAARVKAQEKALTSLLPDERKVIGPQTQLWKKLTDLVNSGWFDSAKVVEEYARTKGMKIPTEAEIKQMRDWSIREQELRKPTPDEVKLYGAQANILVEGTTLEKRQELLRKMNTQWSRWTHPLPSLRHPSTFLDPVKRYNAAMAANEWLTANLLLKLGFGSRQIIDVGTQMLLHTPTRAAQYAFEQWGNDKSAGRDTNLLDNLSQAMTDAYKTRIKVLGDSLASFKRTLAGKGEQKNVEQLISSLAVFDRALLKADEMKAAGRPAAARFLHLLALTMRFGRQFAAAADVIQGVPAEAQEIAHQIRTGLREQGKSAGQQELEFNTILGLLTTARTESLAQARQLLESRGLDLANASIQRAAWHILREKIYSMAKTAGLPADEWKVQNHYYRNVLGWNEPETQGRGKIGGPGGAVAMTAQIGKELFSKAGIPAFPFVFGNAMGISLNRKLAYTPLGLFPGFFKGSPWFEGERNIRQRKIEAVIGTTTGATLMMLAALGIFVVLPRKWPDDEKEKAKWTANGWQPNMVIIPVSDTQEIKISTRVGPMSLLSPWLAAGGAFHDATVQQAKKQQELNERAAKLGLTPEKLEGLDPGQWLNVIGSAAYASAVGGRTSSGMLGSYTDFGTFSAKKSGASATSTLIPGLPGFQEISRMAGSNINPKLASFWDLLVPLPTSDANRVNMLGDPMRNENDIERIFQVLSGGTSPLPADKEQFNKNKAYSNLFTSDYRPPAINPTRGYQFGEDFRSMTEPELQKYTAARGKQFSEELQKLDLTGLTPAAAKKAAGNAFQRADKAALSEIGAVERRVSSARSTISGPSSTAAPIGISLSGRRTSRGRRGLSSIRPIRLRGSRSRIRRISTRGRRGATRIASIGRRSRVRRGFRVARVRRPSLSQFM